METSSFALVMQTAAFLQLILTLAAIASRLSSLLSEIHSCVGLAQTACLQLLQILDVGCFNRWTVDTTHPARQSKLAQDSRHLVYGQHHAARETESVTIETSAVQDMSDHVALDNADEDVGAVLVRRLTTPIEATSAGTPADAAPLLHEDLNLTPAVNGENRLRRHCNHELSVRYSLQPTARRQPYTPRRLDHPNGREAEERDGGTTQEIEEKEQEKNHDDQRFRFWRF